MRRAAMSILCLLVVVACHREPSAPAVAQYIEELDNATDPKQIDDLTRQIYACGPDGIGEIAEAIRRLDYKAKPQLICVLAAIPDDQAIGIIDKQLHNHSQDARMMACQALTVFPGARLWDAYANYLRKEDHDHEWAMYALSRTREDYRKWVYKDAVKNKNEYVRAEALVGLRTVDPSFALPIVQPLVNDPSPLVRNEAFLTMCKIAPRDASVAKRIDELGQQAMKATGENLESYVLILGATGHWKAEPFVSQLMGGPDPRVRALAAYAYGMLGKAAKPRRLMHSFTTDPDYSVRLQASRSIAKLGLTGVENDLSKIVWGRDRTLGKMALDTMVDLNRPECIGPLMNIADHFPNLTFKREAAIGLSNQAIGRAAFRQVDDILGMANAKDPDARKDAAVYLSRLRGPRFYVKLQELLHDPDVEVRLAAMDSMKKQMGMRTKRLTPRQHPLPSWLDDVE